MIRLLFLSVLMVAPASAFAFERVTEKSAFLTLISGKSLSNRLYGVTLQVTSDGSIAGDALGWDITGAWDWRDGYFCRDMAWGSDPIGFNCQLVEAKGSEMRFTSDQGTGDSASFKLR